MGRQHQGMDRPGVQQVLEGSGELGKMAKTVVPQRPSRLTVKGLMMMMMKIPEEYEYFFFVFFDRCTAMWDRSRLRSSLNNAMSMTI